MSGRSAEEARRSARVATTFLVAIDGVDDVPVARRGDISATGIYFETDMPVGSAGTVQFLHIASANLAREIRLLAHVVRAITLEDIGGRRVYGVAFEFMPETEDAAAAVERFVQYVLLVVDEPHRGELQAGEPRLSPRLAALALGENRASDRALVKQLSVRTMTLEASWPVTRGDHLRVEIAARGMARRVRLEGSVVGVTPIGRSPHEPPYEIEVEFQSEIERPPASSTTLSAIGSEEIQAALARKDARPPLAVPPPLPPAPLARSSEPPRRPTGPPEGPLAGGEDVAQVLDDLFSALIHPPESTRPKREHLSGLLSRIRLPTLCTLFDMERLSGELLLRRDEERAIIYVKDGRLIDVEHVEPGLTPRAQVARLLEWEEGSFEFAVGPVVRPDRIGVGTTALLLDLAREVDEARYSGAT